MSLADIRTEQNVIQAYRAESRDKATFLAYAQRADQEGKPQVARLFRAAAASEDIHAHSLLRALRETSPVNSDMWEAELYDPLAIGDSAENLRQAIAGEGSECTEVFPQMTADAMHDGWDYAHECFTQLEAVEKAHVALFQEALKEFGTGGAGEYYVCEFCGNTIGHQPLAECRICEAPAAAFHIVH